MKTRLSNGRIKAAIASAAFALAIPSAFSEDVDNIRLAMNMYSNQRAHQVGDLITVIISEATSSSKSEAISTDKKAEASADAPYFGGAASTSFLSSIANSQKSLPFSRANDAGSIYTVNAASNFAGTGSSSSAETLAITFTARVVDILENGVMVIRGERKILIKHESVSVVLTGLVRMKDIDSKNQVYSTSIADAHIYYENDGDVTRGTQPGYVWRIFQYLNPF